MTYSIQDCRSAARSCGILAHHADSRALKTYWHDVQAQWISAEREINLILAACPSPSAWGADEYRCTECRHVWPRGEPKPPCGSENL